MAAPITRREFLKLAAQAAPLVAAPASAAAAEAEPGWVVGKMTGARAMVDVLRAEGTGCVFGIPGAQENELWDTMKSRGLEYLLTTHEFSAAAMADGAARATGRPGVFCVVPGPGATNCLTGLGEALLDSIPVVAIVGDVARGERYRAFQVHDLPNAEILRPVCKEVLITGRAADIPLQVRTAFHLAQSGEPGPVAVVVPYDQLLEKIDVLSGPLPPPALPFDQEAFDKALALLSDPRLAVGIYAGQGCMEATEELLAVAELLHAPVATSVSGKGVIAEDHPLAVGWGYGPFGTRTAELAFRHADLVLAIGVRYSEVATGFYSIPKHKHLIHVDINPANIGRNVPTSVCVNAEAGLFLAALLAHSEKIGRVPKHDPRPKIARWKAAEEKQHSKIYARHGADPVAFLLALRRATCEDALVFVDVTVAEHWAAEMFRVRSPRTYFNPTDNQSMGWSVPAALGAQRAFPGRQVVTVTGDGCFFMTAMELATAARAGLGAKFFILDDMAYAYMQKIQRPAYLRTTATMLPRLDYGALAQGLGVPFREILATEQLDGAIAEALSLDGPVLVRVAVDYRKRPVRWIEATKDRYIAELSTGQKIRFLGRLGSRALDLHPEFDD